MELKERSGEDVLCRRSYSKLSPAQKKAMNLTIHDLYIFDSL